jgi:amidase
MAAALNGRRTTSAALLRHCLDRIAAFDQTGLGINAIIEINPEAHAIAAARDNDRRRGPLHGLPVLIKDNIDTADAMATTAGSLALADAPKPQRDATIVSKLRDAGMVLIGKANLSEWANIRSPDSTSGWSARGGLTRNPHRPTHSASGSSSGSAAAVAAGFAPAAIGTETNGSIVSPAAACGIVGLKPTVGLLSRAGIIPITQWQDTPGPMTLTSWDAALLLNAMAGPDAGDSHTAAAPAPAEDYARFINPGALRGARLGVLRSECGNHETVLRLFNAACTLLMEAGATLVEVPALPNKKQFSNLAWQAMLTEIRSDLNAYLAARGGAVSSLRELIAFNLEHAREEMPHFGHEFFEAAERRGTEESLAAAATARAEARRLAGPEGIDAVMRAQELDALICPTNDPPGTIDLQRGDVDVRCASTPAAVAGYPHLTVPMGSVHGLPVGLSFMGAAWSEARLLAFGHAFERRAKALRHPVLTRVV